MKFCIVVYKFFFVKCKYIKTERKQKWKNRREAWKGTCSQPANQRKENPRTDPQAKARKQAHNRAKLKGKNNKQPKTNYPTHSSADSSTNVDGEVIFTMEMEHCEE